MNRDRPHAIMPIFEKDMVAKGKARSHKNVAGSGRAEIAGGR